MREPVFEIVFGMVIFLIPTLGFVLPRVRRRLREQPIGRLFLLLACWSLGLSEIAEGAGKLKHNDELESIGIWLHILGELFVIFGVFYPQRSVSRDNRQ